MMVKIPSELDKVCLTNQKVKGASGKCDFVRITERQRLVLKLSLHPSLAHIITPKKTGFRQSKRTSALTGKRGVLEPCLEHPVTALPTRLPPLGRKRWKQKKQKSKLRKQKKRRLLVTFAELPNLKML